MKIFDFEIVARFRKALEKARSKKDIHGNSLNPEVAELEATLNALGYNSGGSYPSEFQSYWDEYKENQSLFQSQGLEWIDVRAVIISKIKEDDRQFKRKIAKDFGVVFSWKGGGGTDRSIMGGSRCPLVSVSCSACPESFLVNEESDEKDLLDRLCEKYKIDPDEHFLRDKIEAVKTIESLFTSLVQGRFSRLITTIGPDKFQQEVDAYFKEKYGDNFENQEYTPEFLKWTEENRKLKVHLEMLLKEFHVSRGSETSLIIGWETDEGETIMIINDGDDNSDEAMKRDFSEEEEVALDEKIPSFFLNLGEFARFLQKKYIYS